MMILMERREQAIHNMCEATKRGDLNAKAEPDDPQVTNKQRLELCRESVQARAKRAYRVRNRIARGIVDLATASVNRSTTIEGLEKIEGIQGGAVVTSNHFSPIDNTVVRYLVRKTGRKRLPIVCQADNYAMTGLFGFMMRNADTIPITLDHTWMTHEFDDMVAGELAAGNFVLIYPEQEMWFNYRKPRTCKRGAYYLAAKNRVPIVSCFVEIIDRENRKASDFVDVSYTMHVLDPLYPDPDKSPRANSIEMCKKDYEQKCAAYEKVYGKPLDYTFRAEDIGGWVPPEEVRAWLHPTIEQPLEREKVSVGE
jgi:1-acyl-sn-glycerol-3-phosphate acyltransferase